MKIRDNKTGVIFKIVQLTQLFNGNIEVLADDGDVFTIKEDDVEIIFSEYEIR